MILEVSTRPKETGEEDRKHSGPTFQHPESNALGQKQRRINKTSDRKILDLIWGKRSRRQDQMAKVTTARIQAEMGYPLFKEAADVSVNQLQGTHTNTDQKHRFEQLERCDQPNRTVVRRLHVESVSYPMG